MTPFARSSILLAVAALVAACATVQPTETIAPNDPAALAAIRAAYVKAGQQKSFRARMTSEGSGKVRESTIEYAAPASVHMVSKTDNLEIIAIGGTQYMKGADGKWARMPIATANFVEQFRKDPEAIAAFERTVSGAQVVGPEMVGTQRATAYRFHQAAKIAGGLASSTGWVKLWVGANGLPLKSESDGSAQVLGFGGGKSKTTMLYEDYGAPVRIVAPAL
jgi:hypothetical protein